VNRRDFIGWSGLLALTAPHRCARAAWDFAGREEFDGWNTRVPHTSIHRVEADGVTVFYREAGAADAPVVLCYMVFRHPRFSIVS